MTVVRNKSTRPRVQQSARNRHLSVRDEVQPAGHGTRLSHQYSRRGQQQECAAGKSGSGRRAQKRQELSASRQEPIRRLRRPETDAQQNRRQSPGHNKLLRRKQRAMERQAAQMRRRLKHREAQRRYEKRAKGRETRRRYQQSAKGLETQFRYRRSAKGADTRWRYEQTPARADYKREWERQYRKTALYKERQFNRHCARADTMFRELSEPGPKSRVLLDQHDRLLDFLIRREAQIRGIWVPAASTIRSRARRERQR